MRRGLIITLSVLMLSVVGGLTYNANSKESTPRRIRVAIQNSPIPSLFPTPTEKSLPSSYAIQNSSFISQSFNNCGPASLAMVMTILGRPVTQEELGSQMRPYQNPTGDNDDKSIFADEFVTYAQKYGFESMHRPNGTIDLLKKFVANDIPVVVRTWLNPDEDIGHFRIVRGYNDTKQTLLQDDSYQGANLEYNYDTFLQMWQPFNYGYILVYPKEKHTIVTAILGEEVDAVKAYQNSIQRAEKELATNNCHPELVSGSSTRQNEMLNQVQHDKNCVYPQFNLSTAYYHLKDYQKAAFYFEQAESQLPSRILWYQLEPMQTYQKLGDRQRVFSMTDRILTNHNRGFSELYLMRGEILLGEGDTEGARAEFENAVFYNKNSPQAQEALQRLE